MTGESETGKTWDFEEEGILLPLAGEKVQQFYARLEGSFLYPGGWMNQPLETLIYAKALESVRALYLRIETNRARQKLNPEHSIWEGLDPNQIQLLTYLEDKE